MAKLSPANRAEISFRLLKQILLKSNCRLHGEVFSPGRNSAPAKNPFNRARIFSPARRAWKSEKISCNRNEISRFVFSVPFWFSWDCSRATSYLAPRLIFQLYFRNVIATKFQHGWPGWNSPCNQALKQWEFKLEGQINYHLMESRRNTRSANVTSV